MMSGQQNKIVIKHLIPELLDDDGINRADWIAKLHKVFVSSGGIAAVVGGAHCLVHDLEHHRWYHYQLPEKGSSWALAQDSTRLWGIVSDGKLTMLDLRSGEWFAFQHRIDYRSILYAEDDVVIAQGKDILAIDVLRLEDDTLRRLASVPFPVAGAFLTAIAFWPEKGRFFALEEKSHHITLRTFGWEGQSRRVLDVKGYYATLCLPFVVMRDEEKNLLVYADLREASVKPKYIDFSFKSEWRQLQWEPSNAFIWDNDLVLVVRSEHLDKALMAIIRLGEEPKVLLEYTFSGNKVYFSHFVKRELHKLGRFLLLDDMLSYDIAAQREVHDVPWSALLRQAICDEVEHQQQTTGIKIPLMLMRESVHSNLDTFRVVLQTLPFNIEEANNKDFSLSQSISSSEGNSALFIEGEKTYGFSKGYLLLRGDKQPRVLLPEPQSGWGYGWEKVTFDEQERAWVCDRSGRHIAVVCLDRQEGLGFVIPNNHPFLQVSAIAAYDDNFAVVRDDMLSIYRYDKQMLNELFQWRNGETINGIKPDTEKGGWWLVTSLGELKYLSLNKQTTYPEIIAQVDYQVRLLGDWPRKVYFVYGDSRDRALCYTLDPHGFWHTVSLRHFLQGELDRIDPIFLSSSDNSVFVLLHVSTTSDGDAYLFMRLRENHGELISAFEQEVKFMRSNDWLILYSDKPLVLAQAYADQMNVRELPKNEGMLFFHLHANQFYERPHESYVAIEALRRMLISKASGLLKSSL
ncbi:MAG: hypothetical protein QXS54_07030 [Candidatus Methanomethylicaceae archaeon]